MAVPEGALQGHHFKAIAAVPKARDKATMVQDPLVVQELNAGDVRARVAKLHTPFLQQANALFRKNLVFQWKRRLSNCCLVAEPIFVLAMVFGIQVCVCVCVCS